MQLRKNSARPELWVSGAATGIVTDVVAAPPAQIGNAGPLGRERCVFALPLGVTQLQRFVLLDDGAGSFFGDPAGVILGTPAVHVHRMLHARWTEDTRRLAG